MMELFLFIICLILAPFSVHVHVTVYMKTHPVAQKLNFSYERK